MAFPYDIDPQQSLVTITYEDPVTFDRWRRTMTRIFADPAYRAGFDFLGDRRAAAKAPSVSYVESIVTFIAEHRAQLQGARWANVVPAGDRAMFGMGYMVDLMAASRGPLVVKTFDDLAEARQWLGARSDGAS